MTVSSVGSTTSTTNTSTSSSSSSTGLASVSENFSTFLSILTTQLTHQDPTDATDTNQFTQELVEFSQVEQQLNTNSDLEQLIALQKSSGGLTATLNYIGQYAEVQTTTNAMVLQNGSSEIGYGLNSAGTSATITVEDANGTVINTLSGSANAGMNYLTWNGTDSSGNTVADGTYTYVISVTNSDGTTQTPAANYTIAKVTGVTSNSDGTYNLSLGGLSVTSDEAAAVFDADNLPESTAPTS